MNAFLQDLRYSWRGLTKSPMFTIIALLSLTLGVGANTAVFSLLDQVLLRSLPVKHPEQLVLFRAPGPRHGSVNTSYDDSVTFSYPMYREVRDGNQVFDGVIARFPVSFSLSWRDRSERVTGDLVSGNFFETLGVHAAIGRTFTNADDRVQGAENVVMLSHDYWRSRFGASPDAVNQTIILNGQPMAVVGVVERGFKGVGVGEGPDVFVPIAMQHAMFPRAGTEAGQNDLTDRHSMWLNIFARLKPGVSRGQAEASMNAFWRPLLEFEVKDISDMPQSVRTRYLNRHLSLSSGARGISNAPDSFEAAMVVLMSMVGVLLLIACANVANLLVVRGTARRKEVGIRIALGAGRFRIIRQLLAESLILSLAGGALGVLTAAWAGNALLGFLPTDSSTRGLSADPDVRVLLFTLTLSIFTAVVFGLAPAIQSARQAVAATLKEEASAVVGGAVGLRKGLVVSQVALSLVLLIGAGLFARSLLNVKKIDAGFRSDHLISFTIQPAYNGYSQPRTLALYSRLYDDLAALPGIHGVTMSEIALLGGDNEMSTMRISGYQPKEDESMSINANYVGPGYLATMGISIVAGRDFTQQDTADTPRAAVINEVMAKRYFVGENPLGRQISFRRDKPAIEIVGVVRDGKHAGLREKDEPFIYFPYTQYPVTASMTFYARTASNPISAAGMLQQQVRQLDPNLPIFNVKTMDRQIDESIFTDRLLAALSASFGVLATLLAAIGLYGVMAYMVARRTREIGIRMALGANRQDVLRLVIKEVVLLAGIGIGVALIASVVMGRVIGSQLFGISGHDPLVFVLATAGLATVALLAGYIPAIRATRVDPLIALRYE